MWVDFTFPFFEFFRYPMNWSPTFQHITRAFRVVIAVAVLTSTVAVAEEKQQIIGISKEKPKEGRFVKTDLGYMVPYKETLPGSDVQFEMLPIPGGVFRMGSPDSEKGRAKTEGPTFEVEIPPFWMAKYEVTWKEYKEFMSLYEVFKQLQSENQRLVTKDNELDAITAPTKLYEPSFTFEKGEHPQLPAVTMTQYAARQYAKWISLSNGAFYRLPTEAEWEYACRAGAKTAYHFGDDPKKLDDYAWYAGNSGEAPHLVGQKKPNPWGLYDMHGNAAEWVLDMMLEDGYSKFKGKKIGRDDAIVWPVKQDPRVVRGGHWESTAEECRAAARLGTETEYWKGSDPNIPLSPWWFTDDPSRGVGMRLVRPLKAPNRKSQEKHWKETEENFVFDIEVRLEEGRGALGLVDPKLPETIRAYREKK